jgi:hypothetical protein
MAMCRAFVCSTKSLVCSINERHSFCMQHQAIKCACMADGDPYHPLQLSIHGFCMAHHVIWCAPLVATDNMR